MIGSAMVRSSRVYAWAGRPRAYTPRGFPAELAAMIKREVRLPAAPERVVRSAGEARRVNGNRGSWAASRSPHAPVWRLEACRQSLRQESATARTGPQAARRRDG